MKARKWSARRPENNLSSVVKALLNVLGSVFLVLAALGVLLPLVPTTPFLLLASACYLRGSERLHGRLMSNRLFGAYLRNVRERRGLPRRAKIISLGILWLSLLFSIYRIELFLLELMLILIGITVSVLFLRMKTLRDGA